jgi:hypothetical protein
LTAATVFHNNHTINEDHRPSQVFFNNAPRMSDPPQTLSIAATFRGSNEEEV